MLQASPSTTPIRSNIPFESASCLRKAGRNFCTSRFLRMQRVRLIGCQIRQDCREFVSDCFQVVTNVESSGQSARHLNPDENYVLALSKAGHLHLKPRFWKTEDHEIHLDSSTLKELIVNRDDPLDKGEYIPPLICCAKGILKLLNCSGSLLEWSSRSRAL